MEILLKIVGFLIGIFILVLIHEFGHFAVAKLLKIKVLRFAIGFGKPFFKRCDKSGTEYTISPFLLGGYVKVLDGQECEIPKGEEGAAFDLRPIWQRSLVIGAGIFANFLFAILAFWLMFVIGIQELKPIVGEISPALMNQVSQFQVGDEIVAVDNVSTRSWEDVLLTLFTNLGDKDPLGFKVRRGAKLFSFSLPSGLYDLALDPYLPNPLTALGIKPFKPFVPAVVGGVVKDNPAFKAGLKKGDRIIALNGHRMVDWESLIDFIQARPNRKISLTIMRQNKTIDLNLVSGVRRSNNWQKIGYIGIKSKPVAWPEDMQRTIRYSPITAFIPALAKTWRFVEFNGVIFYKLVTGKISLHVLGGPISILQVTGTAFLEGVAIFVGFLGLLSVMLGVVNLLPIPVLDGGFLLFLLIEKLRRKPISQSTQLLMYRFGLVFLMLIFVHASFNDVVRFF